MGAMSGVITKQCTKCGEVKALDAFYAKEGGKHGVASTCKDCVKIYLLKNKERISEQKRKYRQENKEREAERRRKYYEENKERSAKTMRNYYEENKEKIAEYQRAYNAQWRKDNPEAVRRSSRKRRALKRFLPHAPLTSAQYERLYEFRDQVFGEVTS